MSHSASRIIRFIILLLGLSTTVLTLASDRRPPLRIGHYTLITVTQASGNNYDFAYRAKATNKNANALPPSRFIVTPASPKGFQVIDLQLSSGPIAAGATIPSIDTLTLRKRGVRPFEADGLNEEHQWLPLANAPPTANAGYEQTLPRKMCLTGKACPLILKHYSFIDPGSGVARY